MATKIQLKTGTGSAVPSSLTQGEVGINIDNGLIYYGSGSGNNVKQLESFTNITASGNISASGTFIGITGSFGRGNFDDIILAQDILKLNTNNKFLQGKETGGTSRNILGLNSSNVIQVANANLKTDIKGTNINLDAPVTASIISASSTFVGAPIQIVTHAWFSNVTSKFPAGDLTHLINGNSNFGWADRAWNDSVLKSEIADNNQLDGVPDHNKGVPIQHNVTDIQLTGYMRASNATDVTEMNYWIYKGNKVNNSGPSVTFLASASAATVGTNFNEIYITGSTGLQADAGDLIFVFANTDVGTSGTSATDRNVRGMYTVTAKIRE